MLALTRKTNVWNKTDNITASAAAAALTLIIEVVHSFQARLRSWDDIEHKAMFVEVSMRTMARCWRLKHSWTVCEPMCPSKLLQSCLKQKSDECTVLWTAFPLLSYSHCSPRPFSCFTPPSFLCESEPVCMVTFNHTHRGRKRKRRKRGGGVSCRMEERIG